MPWRDVVSIPLNWRREQRSHDLDPARVHAGLDAVDLVEGVLAVLLVPEVAGVGIERHAEAVADAVGEDLLDVGADFAADRSHRRDQNGLSAGVDPSSFSRRITPVKCALSASGPPNWSSATVGPRPGRGRPRGQVLQLAAAAVVAEHDVELAVRSEADDAAVVVAAGGLFRVALVRRLGRARRSGTSAT